MPKPATAKTPRAAITQAKGACVCGKVEIEIDAPAFWAWHDHSRATQRAQGCAYATYIGVWKSRMRVAKGAKSITRFEDPKTHATRAFCAHCGTPLMYQRPRSPRMIDLPRALFDGRTGREPRYHRYLDESPDWAYRQESLKLLKGYPGVLIEKTRKKKQPLPDFF